MWHFNGFLPNNLGISVSPKTIKETKLGKGLYLSKTVAQKLKDWFENRQTTDQTSDTHVVQIILNISWVLDPI